MRATSALALIVLAAGEPTAADEQPALATRLGAAVNALRPGDMSAEVLRRTKATVLDVLGTLAYTARTNGRDPYIARLRERGGAPEARVLGIGVCTSSEDAAGALAYLIHGAETDDSDFRAELRASPVVMGPALASAAAADATGAEFLLSAAVGYTLMGRVAAPFGPLQPRGWMSSGVWGSGAGAAVAARAFRLDAGKSGQAVALGAAAGGGPFQYYYDQTEDKRLVVARAAVAGVGAARLAELGEHGSPRIYEGVAGLFHNIDSKVIVETDRIAKGLAALEGPLYLYPKFYAASSSILPALEGLARAERSGTLRREGVVGVTLREGRTRGRVVAAKLSNFEPPETIIGAKLNWAFMVALYLVRGEAALDRVGPATLRDPEVLRLAQRIDFEPIDDSLPASVVVRYADGRHLVVEPNIIDTKQPAPFAAEARIAKFERLTAALSPGSRRELKRLADTVDSAQSMRTWIRAVDRALAPVVSRDLVCDRPIRERGELPRSSVKASVNVSRLMR